MDNYGNEDNRDVFGNGSRDSFGNSTNLNSFGNQPSDVWGNSLGGVDPNQHGHDHHGHDQHDDGSHDPHAHDHDVSPDHAHGHGLLDGLWNFFSGGPGDHS